MIFYWRDIRVHVPVIMNINMLGIIDSFVYSLYYGLK